MIRTSFWEPRGARLPENNDHLTERQALYILTEVHPDAVLVTGICLPSSKFL